MQEGWGDVIGYITEFARQPAGSGPEKAEWKAGEDAFASGGYGRRVDVDDGPGNYAFHKLDDPANTEAHNRGNMLPVAFRLVDVGGRNPICSRSGDWTPDCDVSITGQGFTKAKQVFFRMLTYYCTSTTGWEDLADLGKLAAFSLYCDGQHPFSSCMQQRATEYAFRAIGYPPADLSCYQCPTLP